MKRMMTVQLRAHIKAARLSRFLGLLGKLLEARQQYRLLEKRRPVARYPGDTGLLEAVADHFLTMRLLREQQRWLRALMAYYKGLLGEPKPRAG